MLFTTTMRLKMIFRLLRVGQGAIPLVLCLTMALPPVVSAGAPGSDALLRSVDCDAGGSVRQALRMTLRHPLIVEVRGTCRENLTLTRDDVSLRGFDGARLVGNVQIFGTVRVELRDLAVEGRRGLEPLVHVRDSRAVKLKDLALHGAPGDGLLAQSSELYLEGVTVESAAGVGLRAQASRFELGDSVAVIKSGVGGLQAERVSQIVVRPGGELSMGAQPYGLLLEQNSSLALAAGAKARLEGHSAVGLALVGQGMVRLAAGSELDARGNGLGILLSEGSTLAAGDDGAVLRARESVHAGIMALHGDLIELGRDTEVSNNGGPGLWVEGSTASLYAHPVGNSGGDVVAGFGSRLRIAPSAPELEASCDATVLTQGQIACGPGEPGPRPAALDSVLASLTADPLSGPVVVRTPVRRATTVDCDSGESLAAALQARRRYLTVSFTGTCVGDAAIARDDVVLRGADASAEIVGQLLIQGAARVRLSDFAVRDTATSSSPFDRSKDGVRIVSSRDIVLENLEVLDVGGRGVSAENSTVRLRDLSVEGAQNIGIVGRSSHVLLAGTIRSHGNLATGICVRSTGSLTLASDADVVADGSPIGIFVERNSAGFFEDGARVELTGNGIGLTVGGQSALQLGDIALRLANNEIGMLVQENSHVVPYGPAQADLRVQENLNVGVLVTGYSGLTLHSGEISNNSGTGLFFSLGRGELTGVQVRDNGVLDVGVAFGSRVDFGEENDFGLPVFCEDGSLARGVACGRSARESSILSGLEDDILAAERAIRDLPLSEEPSGGVGPAASLPRRVDCDAGERLGEALEAGRRHLVFSGTCSEQLHIAGARDLVLEGQGEARLVGSLELTGGRRVTLRGFELVSADFTGGGSPGDQPLDLLRLVATLDAHVEDLRIEGGDRGMVLAAGTVAALGDVEVLGASSDGFVLDTARVDLFGALTSRDHGASGGLFKRTAHLFIHPDGELAALANAGSGIEVLHGSVVMAASATIRAENNLGDGYVLADQSALSSAGSLLAARQNGGLGARITRGSNLIPFSFLRTTIDFSGNASGGLTAIDRSVVVLSLGALVQDNDGAGFVVSNSFTTIRGATFSGNTGDDLVLLFAGRASFGPVVTFEDPIRCDASALTTGGFACELDVVP